MPATGRRKIFLQVLMTASLLLLRSPLIRCQSAPAGSSLGAPPADALPDIRTLAESVRALQVQVQSLNSQVSELRTSEEREHAEARALRNELNRATAKLVTTPGATHDAYASVGTPANTSVESTSLGNVAPENTAPTAMAAVAAAGPGRATTGEQGGTIEERVAKLEDNLELTDAKVQEQSQTKVESGSKYRVRLSGMVLLNAFETRGAVDNLDFPEIATAPEVPGTSGAFAGSLRQSQIGLSLIHI